MSCRKYYREPISCKREYCVSLTLDLKQSQTLRLIESSAMRFYFSQSIWKDTRYFDFSLDSKRCKCAQMMQYHTNNLYHHVRNQKS